MASVLMLSIVLAPFTVLLAIKDRQIQVVSASVAGAFLLLGGLPTVACFTSSDPTSSTRNLCALYVIGAWPLFIVALLSGFLIDVSRRLRNHRASSKAEARWSYVMATAGLLVSVAVTLAHPTGVLFQIVALWMPWLALLSVRPARWRLRVGLGMLACLTVGFFGALPLWALHESGSSNWVLTVLAWFAGMFCLTAGLIGPRQAKETGPPDDLDSRPLDDPTG
jgi:hypothetical protein